MWPKFRLFLYVALLPLLALDCAAYWLCVLVGKRQVRASAFLVTLSAEAWNHREHKYWGWTHRWIDWLFACPAIGQVNHCRVQSLAEARHGSAWKVWWLTDKQGWASLEPRQ